MSELTTQSTFREFAEAYFKAEALNKETRDIITQKTRYKNGLCPLLGDMILTNIDYKKYIEILLELRKQGYSKGYIHICLHIIKQIITLADELNLIEKQEFVNQKTAKIISCLDIYMDDNTTTVMIKPYNNIYNRADYIITRHTSVLSYLIFLHNNNDFRKDHKIPSFILTAAHKSIDINILNKPLNEITEYDIKIINKNIRQNNYSYEYIRTIAQILRFVFTIAYEKGLTNTLLYDVFDVPRSQGIKELYYSDEKYNAIKTAINQSELKNLYIVAESAGLLKSEVLAIEINCFNAVEGLLTINSHLVRDKKQKLAKENYLSTKRRTIKLPDVAITALKNEIEKREAKKLLAGDKWDRSSNYIFTDNYDNHISEGTIKNDVCIIKTISGVENFNLKNLRKNAIYMMTTQNIPIHQLLEYLGLKFERGILKLSNKAKHREHDWRENVV